MNDVTQSQQGAFPATATLSGKKILVVEDDRFLHRLLADKLQQWKADIASSFDGSDALEKLKTEKPDIILLDIILPEIDGFNVLKKIKSDDKLKDIPVIILSNLGQEEDIEKGTKLGAEDFLIKANFTLDEIVAKVSALLEKRGKA